MVEVSLEQPKVKWLGQVHNSDIRGYRVGFKPITIHLKVSYDAILSFAFSLEWKQAACA